MYIVRKSSLTPIPWKNGGGVTHEVIRVPAGGGEFQWRVSIANIGAAGDFSHFPGVTRTMVLLRGEGVALTFDGASPTLLRAPGDVVVFDGARSTYCELLGGACTDLNLMVAQSAGDSRAWVARLDVNFFTATSPSPTTLVFPIVGRVSLSGPSTGTECLDEWDLAVLSAGEAVTVARECTDAAVPLVFFATLDAAPR